MTIELIGAGLGRTGTLSLKLAGAFPEAPVLLSTRSSAQVWYDSAEATIFQSSKWQPTDDAGAMAAYEAHHGAVRREIPADRMFEYQPGDGWSPLCAALGLAEPVEPFPHTNTREEFRTRSGIDDPA